jgi:hypothetical protein
MITASQCINVIGDPTKEREMVVWDVPAHLEIGNLPNKIYCNKRMVQPLTTAFTNIINRGLVDQVRTWDGCFNIRKSKGSTSRSLHSWGLAIDINAEWNGYNKPVTMSKELVDCFKDTDMFDWGGDWHIKDGMHFQLKQL